MEYRLFKDAWLMGVKEVKCAKCHKKFDAYIDLSDFESPGCLKCDKCKKYFMYYVLEPIFKELGIEALGYPERKVAIEKLLSPCKLCGGALKHYNLSAKGFPDECPNCGSKEVIDEKKEAVNRLEKRRIEVTKIGFKLDKSIPESSFAHQQWAEENRNEKMKRLKFSLEGMGLIIIFGGALIKVWLQNISASGVLIDLARSTFFLGIIIVALGLIRRRKKHN